jgi:hypothetical protein
MADADVAESVENALIGQHAVGDRELMAKVGKFVWHGKFLIFDCGAAKCVAMAAKPK